MVVYSKVIKFVAAVVALVYTSSSQHFTHVSHWVTIRLKVSGQSFLRVWGISSMNGFVDFLLVSGPLAPNSDQCAPRWAQKVSLKTFKFWHLIKRLSKVCFKCETTEPRKVILFLFLLASGHSLERNSFAHSSKALYHIFAWLFFAFHQHHRNHYQFPNRPHRYHHHCPPQHCLWARVMFMCMRVGAMTTRASEAIRACTAPTTKIINSKNVHYSMFIFAN